MTYYRSTIGRRRHEAQPYSDHMMATSTKTTTVTTPAAGEASSAAASGKDDDEKDDDDDDDDDNNDDNVVWLRILQINDVYELDNMAALKSIIDQHVGMGAHADLIVLAGDFLGPSLLSSLNQGASMVDCLNACGFTHVCLGNHETDLSNMPMSLDARVGQSQFTWINSNLPTLEDKLQRHGHEMKRYDVVTVTNEKTGVKKTIGMLGLLTPDPGLYRPGAFCDCEIQPVIPTTHRWLAELKEKIKVDFVLPLTHQGMAEDEDFCNEFGGNVFPLVIGGHDHTVVQETINGCYVSKVGHDAQHVAIIDLKWTTTSTNTDSSSTDNTTMPTITVHPLLNTADFEPNPEMAARVASHNRLVQELERARLFNIQDWVPTSSDNDGNEDEDAEEDEPSFFSTVDNRLGPSTGTTAFCSMLRMGLHADVAILNAGSVRGGRHYAPDTVFTYKELKAEIPYPTLVSAYYIPGHVLQETIYWSRRFARQDPPVAHGCYLHTCDAMDLDEDPDDDHKITILSIQNKPFDRNQLYLTVLPIQFLLGIDHHEPLLQWAAQEQAANNNRSSLALKCDNEHDEAGCGVPAKYLIVEVFSTLVWLQMGSFADMDVDGNGRIGRKEVHERLQSIYGSDVADVIVDNVMSMADMNGNDEISPLEMALAHYCATDMMMMSNSTKHRGSLKRQSIMIRETVQAVLGRAMSQHDADAIAIELRKALDAKSKGGRNGGGGGNNNNNGRVGSGSIDRSGIRNVMGGLRRMTLLGPKVD